MAQLGPTILTLQTDVRRQGGTVIDRIWDWVDGSLKWQDTCAGSSNRGYATFTLPADSRIIGVIAELQVVRIDQRQPAGSAVPFKTWEYRITEIDDAAADPNVVVTCSPIVNDFARVLLRSVNGGVPTKLTTFTGTPDQFINALLIPALVAQGKTGVAAGTIDVGPAMQFNQRNASVLSVGSWLEQTYTKDFFLERVDDTTDLLHFTTRGAGLASPRAILGRNVRELKRTILVDDGVFANIIEAEGVTANGETEPTTIAQAAWLAESKSGTGNRVIAVADPLGGIGPIATDHELDGLRALYALDPLHLSRAPLLNLGLTTIGNRTFPGCPLALALDTTRRILWGYTQDDTDTIWWRDLVDDENEGTLSLGAGALWISGMGYDAVHDRVVCTCGDVAKAVLINASTKAVAGTVTLSDVPAFLCGVANGFAFVGYNATDIDVVSTSGSGSLAGTLAGTASMGGAGVTVMHHAGTDRYFALPTNDLIPMSYYWFNNAGASFAALGSGTALRSAASCADPSQTSIAWLSASTFTLINPSTGARTDVTTPPFPYTPSGMFGAPLALFAFHSRYYLLTSTMIIGYDSSTNEWLTPAADVGRASGTPTGGPMGYSVEPGPSSSENVTVYTSDIGTIRRFVLTQAEDLVSPFEAFDIADSDASAETITAPASGSGGPVNIPVEADAAGQGALIEIRENAALDYRTQQEDPASVSSAGAVSSAPQFGVLAKRNYWRGSSFDAGSWRTDRRNRWMATIRRSLPAFGFMETRWSQADQTGFSFKPIVLTADWHNSSTTPDLTMAVSGLNNGTVLSPGDYITAAPRFAGQIGWFVRQRTVADSGGNATIPVTPSVSGLSNVTTGTTVYLTSPSLLLANGRPDGLALYPNRDPINGWVDLPHFSALVPVPRIVGDQRIWVVAHISLANYTFSPVDLQMRVWPPYIGTPLNAFHDPDFGLPAATQWPQVVTPPDNVQLSTGELREYWLSQPLDTINYPSHGFVRVELTTAVNSAMINSRLGVCYVHSLQVVLAAQTTQPRDLYGAEGPVALAQLGAARLLAVHNPTQNFQLSVVEDDVARPWEVGAIATLRDPQRAIGVQDESSRVISVTRYGKLPDAQFEAPDIEIGHAPLNTFVPGIVTTDSTVKTPTPPLLPGSPLPGGVGGGGGTGSAPGLTNMAPLFIEDAGGGPRHTDTLYIYENESMVHQMTGGRNNGPHWLTRNFCSEATFMAAGHGTKEGRVLLWIDLTGKTLDADGQLLWQGMNNNDSGSCHLAFGLNSTGHVVVYRTDAAADVLLQTSSAAVPSSGRYLLELGWLIDPAAGYVTCKGYDLSAGSPTIKDDLFAATGKNTLSDNAGGVAEDIEITSWGSDAFTTTAFQVGGIDDIPMAGFGFFDATGLGYTAFVGDVMALTAFVASNGNYADVASIPWQLLNCKEAPGRLSCGRFESSTQRNSYGVATFDASSVASILAVAPFGTYANDGGTSARVRPGVRSSSTDVDNGSDLRVVFSDWGGSLGIAPSDGLDKNVYFTHDPATSAAWTKTAAQSAEVIIQSKGTDRLLVTQAGLTIVYRPVAGTDGQVNGNVGSRDQPVTPLEWLDLNAVNPTGQGVHANYKNNSTGSTRILGDPFTNATAGADGGRALTFNDSYAGSGVWSGSSFGFILGPIGASYWLADFPPSFANGSFNSPAFMERSQQKTAGCWVNLNSHTLASDLKLFSFYDTSGVEAVAVYITTARKVRIDNIHGSGNPFNLVAATSTALGSSGLYQIEVELGLDSVFGYVNAWLVNGSTGTRTLIGSASPGTNTRHTSGKNIGAVVFGFSPGVSDYNGVTVSDAFVASCGTTGGGTGLGGCRAATLLANAVGAHNDSGGPYTKVTDDVGSGGTPDGDYNVLTAAGQVDTYKVQGAPGDCSTVFGAMTMAYISRAPGGSGTNQGRTVLRIGGAEIRSNFFDVTHDWPDGDGSTSDLNSSRAIPSVATLNPATGAALAASDFSGSNAEAGYLLDARHDNHWIRQVWISLLYAWTH